MTEPTCPQGHPLERHEDMFYWRGSSRPGLVCPICKSLFTVPGEEIEPLRPSEGRPATEWTWPRQPR